MIPLFKSILFSLILSLALLSIQLTGIFHYHEIIRYTWYSLGFFSMLNLMIIFLVEKGVKAGSLSAFMWGIMGGNLLKIFLSAGGFFGFFYFFQIKPKIFIFPYLLLYVIFLVFETTLILKIE